MFENSSTLTANETIEGSPAQHAADSQPEALLTVDDFAALEERVLRAVNLVRQERQLRAASEEKAASLDSQLREAQAKINVLEALQQEVKALRLERDQVRQRVERLLGQLDALEL